MSTQFRAVYLEEKYNFIEDETITMSFLIYDEQNNELSASDLADYKFYAELTNGSDEITKQDANYAGGGATEMALSSNKLMFYITEDETDSFEGRYDIEINMVNKTDSNRYIIFRDSIYIKDTIQD